MLLSFKLSPKRFVNLQLGCRSSAATSAKSAAVPQRSPGFCSLVAEAMEQRHVSLMDDPSMDFSLLGLFADSTTQRFFCLNLSLSLSHSHSHSHSLSLSLSFWRTHLVMFVHLLPMFCPLVFWCRFVDVAVFFVAPNEASFEVPKSPPPLASPSWTTSEAGIPGPAGSSSVGLTQLTPEKTFLAFFG